MTSKYQAVLDRLTRERDDAAEAFRNMDARHKQGDANDRALEICQQRLSAASAKLNQWINQEATRRLNEASTADRQALSFLADQRRDALQIVRDRQDDGRQLDERQRRLNENRRAIEKARHSDGTPFGQSAVPVEQIRKTVERENCELAEQQADIDRARVRLEQRLAEAVSQFDQFDAAYKAKRLEIIHRD